MASSYSKGKAFEKEIETPVEKRIFYTPYMVRILTEYLLSGFNVSEVTLPLGCKISEN